MSFLAGNETEVWKKVCARLSGSGGGDVYFSPEYLSLYTNERLISEAFLYEKGGDVFFFPYLRQNLPAPYSDYSDFETVYGYGGPLSNQTERGFLKEAWDRFGEESRNRRLVAGLVRFHPLIDNHELVPARNDFEVCRLRHTVQLNLQKSEEAVWSGYHANTRNKIQKARKEAIQVDCDGSLEGLLKFGSIYRERMHDVGAGSFYHFNDDYFRGIFNTLKNSYRLFLAKKDGVCEGGVLALESADYAHLHLSAVRADAQPRGTASLLRHEAILYFLNKKKIFHFGGGTSNREDDSVLKFKMGFSKELNDFWIGKIMINEKIYHELCAGWEKANPEKMEASRTIFLKYRI